MADETVAPITPANPVGSAVDTSRDPTELGDQMEMFLFKFPDVGRSNITELMEQFKTFDLENSGDLSEDQAMRLLEARGETRTFRELRQLVADIDVDHNRRVNFLEWATCIYNKDWVELHNLATTAAYEAAKKAIEDAKRAEEEAAAQRASELEAESKLTGVAGMAAFFRRQAEATEDATMTNEQRIKAEAARRKALREAKANNAETAIAKQKAEAEAAEKAAADAEAAERAARRAAFKAKQAAMFERGGASS